jgi:DNA-binding SARP family transcriptional activator
MTDPGGLEVLLLGPLEVRRDGEPLRLGGGKPRMLVADLALHLGEPVSVDRLIDDLWGERPPKSAPHAIETYVSQLRKLDLALPNKPPGYVLELEPDRLDTVRFTERTAEGCALIESDPESAGAILRGALSLWRGPALADFVFEPFSQTDIARLEELRQECLEGRIEADLAAGRHADLVSELEALVRAEPLRERLRRQLMLALYRNGRGPDALAAYRATREMLLDELGMEPGPELRELEAAILRQDESLLVPAARVSVPRPAQRKLATIVAVELEEPADALDPEAVHALVAKWHEQTAAVVTRHGGRVQSVSDDAVVAVFGFPVAREDDALRAARAALELTGDVNVRVGVETGEVVADNALVAGGVLKRARTAARAAEPGTVLVGDQAAALLAHAARFDSSRLLEVAEDAPAFERRLDAALVGRKGELATLKAALAEAIESGTCRAVQIVGAPGIGKTRLTRELAVASAERAVTLRGACVAEGAGSTYRPLLRIVREAVGSVDAETINTRMHDEAAAAVLAAGLGAGEGTPSPPEVAWAFRRFCEALAAERPLVVVFDDVQWAEPTLLELVEQLATRGAGPILVLCLAREELLEERPSFLGGAERIVLDALSPKQTTALLKQLIGDRPLSDELLARVVESAEGNPLFVEQLLAFVAEEGTLVGRPLPPTIQALLAARLDRLGPGERAVLSRAAIVGRRFYAADLSVLLDSEAAATAERHLRTLVGRGFVCAAGDAYRFRHALVQEAVYRATAKAERADLHERYADHLDDAAQPDELVGFHLERAHELQAELGAEDRHVRQLATDAGTRLGAAGITAWKRNDVPATVGLLRRATDLLDADSPLARELTCELGLALRAGGDADAATAALEHASRSSSSAADAHVELRARMELAFVRVLEERGATDHELLELAETSIPTFEALEDERALGRAWLLAGYVHGSRHLRCKAWEDAAGLALVHYQRARWPTATCLGQLANALYDGPTHAAQAATRCEELLSERLGPADEANVLVFLGGFVAMLGRLDDGRSLVGRARAIFEDLGQIGLVGMFYGKVAGAIEMFAGEFSDAERILLESCELLQRASLKSTFATRAGELAAALYAQGSYDDANRWASAAEEAAAPDDLYARLAWQPVRAKLVALTGDNQRGRELASDAAAAAQGTDALNQRARTLLDLAEVQRISGSAGESASAVDAARRDLDLKGNRLAAERLGVPAAI